MLQNNYQPHIDVLRALAVMLVILNHLDFSLFSGGFIGVDVFFVISGYLITKNIIKEKELTKKFSFREFYKRRIIRLAPAFLTVIFISSLFFLSVMTPMEINDYLKTVIASLILTSNIYYTSLLNDYFSITAKSTPLLHIWSLNLEEQFYLFWPLFIVLTLRFRKLIGLALIGSIFAFSLFVSHEIYKANPTAAYYLLPSRVFEFAIGASLAFIKPLKLSSFQSLCLSCISIFGIIITSILIDKNTIFPSYTAVIPCFFSALFIYTAQNFSTTKLKSIQYLGKISYPMYLWHWPLIVYLSIHSINLNWLNSIILITLTIAFSTLTHEKIEKKSIYYLKITKNSIRSFIVFPSLIMIFTSIIIIQVNKKNHTPLDIDNKNSYLCLDSNLFVECLIGDKKGKTKVELLLIGDSHANSHSPIIDILSLDAKILGHEFTQSTTIFLPETDCIRTDKNEKEKTYWINRFRERNDLIKNMIKKNHYRFVVMGGYFTMNYCIYSNEKQKDSTKAFLEGMDKAIDLVLKTSAIPVIIQDNPLLRNVDINCNLRSDKPNKSCRYDSNLHLNHIKTWDSQLLYLKNKYPKLLIIDFTSIICPDGFCYSHLNNVPLYRDKQHLTHTGSTEIGIKYLKKFGNPLKPHDH